MTSKNHVNNRVKVSILMNCFNGEKYLRQAIDSIYAQDFQDWEIIFIDNRSSDSSMQIAKSYDNKVKYHTTPYFMSLGEARKWGIGKCNGEYLCILDVDNYWFPSFLSTMYSEIVNLNRYLMVYCGYEKLVIDKGSLKKIIPKKKQGMILKDLLYQCDIEPNGTITDLNLLKESGLNFDPNVKVSDSYCLYIQLAARYNFKAVDKSLFLYRWHDNNLTVKNISRWGYERKYALDLLKKNNSSLRDDKKYKKAFREAYARGIYYEARLDIYQNNRKEAIIKLFSIFNISWKYLLLLIISILPIFIWKRLHHEYTA